MSARHIKAEILVNRRIAPRYYKTVLSAPVIARAAKPGNFLMVKAADGAAPLLRRPLSIHNADPARGAIELLYEVVGPATEILAKKRAGEFISVIGPLGNGFSFGAGANNRNVILVAGGMGVAPLLFLARRLRPGEAMVLIGARTRAQVLCASEFRKLGCVVRIATDDGSAGFHGRVTELFENTAARLHAGSLAIYGCGPRPMLQAMAKVCQAHNLFAQVSLEAHMACGIGACLGCVVRTKKGFQRVCKEGPVFRASDVVW